MPQTLPPGHGAELAKLRKSLELTQRELAAVMGVTQPAVSAWEYERRGPPDFKTCWALVGLATVRSRWDVANTILDMMHRAQE